MTFIPNPNFEREFNNELEVRAKMLAIAEGAAVAVRQIAPRGPTGFYHESIEAGEDETSAFVTTKDFAGHLVEWGSVNNPPYGPLRRGVTAVGLELKELPKH